MRRWTTQTALVLVVTTRLLGCGGGSAPDTEGEAPPACNVLLLEGLAERTPSPPLLPDAVVQGLAELGEDADFRSTHSFSFRELGAHESVPTSGSITRRLALTLSERVAGLHLAWTYADDSHALAEGVFERLGDVFAVHVEANTWDGIEGARFAIAARCQR